MKKRILSMLLTLGMVCTMLPVSVLATGAENDPITVGNTTQITGAGKAGTDHQWSVDDDSIATVSWTDNVATVKALRPGTVTVTHSFDLTDSEEQSSQQGPDTSEAESTPTSDASEVTSQEEVESPEEITEVAEIPDPAVMALQEETFTVTVEAGDYVALIETEDGIHYYTSLSGTGGAINASVSGNTIELLQNASLPTTSFPAEETVVIDGNGYTIDANQAYLNIAGNVTFENCTMNMYGVPNGHWMYIYMASNGVLTFRNAMVSIDGAEAADNTTAMYFPEPGTPHADVNIENSTVTIQNCDGNGISWGGSTNNGYNQLNITNSTVTIDNCAAQNANGGGGIIGTFDITVTGSKLTVTNNRSYGSNGSNYYIDDSIVNYSNNGTHGLSATDLTIKNGSQVTADSNGYYGVYANGDFLLDSTSTLTVTRNSYSGDFAGLKLTNGVTNGLVEAGATVTITDNYCSGLSNNGKVVFEEGVDLTITGNNNDKGTTSNGGGVYNSGASANLTLPSDAVIYNNHAVTAGDDIFNNTTATISFGNVGTDWYLDGGEDCEDLIDGWYDDSKDNRWEAHNSSALHVNKETPGSLSHTGLLALKAAHGVLEDDGEQEPSEWEVDVNKTAESLDENNRTDVTLTVGGEQGLDNVAVLFVFDKSTSVDVREAAESLVDELSTKENTNIKVATVNFYQEAEVQRWTDFNSMSEEEKTAFFQFNTTGKGGTNYHAGLLAAQDLLSADEIDGYAVYFITISDGITYIWNEDVDQNGTLEPATVWANLSDPHSAGSATQNGASSWEFKYKAGTGDIQGFEYHYTDSIRGFLKSDSTAQAYKNLFTDGLLYSYNHSLAVGDKAAVIEGDGTTPASGKTIGSASVASVDTNGNAILSTDITAASSTDGYLIAPEAAIYKTAEAFNEILNMMEASGNGSHVYVLSLPEDENQWTSNPYGRELMEYMSGETATTVDNEEISGSTAAETFSDIADEILYAIDSGTVNDIISSYFDLTDKGSIDENTFTLTVGGDPVTDIIVEGNTVSFGTPTDGVYPYVVTYNPGTASVPEQFDWQINVPVETNKPVELTYSLTLVSLPVGTGTIRIPTNEEATLEYTTSTDQTGTETFPIPEVNYKVEAPDNALVISKTVHGTTDASILEQEFEFTVDLEAEGEYTYRFLEGNGESGTISDGGKIDLTSGDSIAIEGIPEGTSYTVTETAVEDFTATVDKSDGAASLAVLLNEKGLSATGTIGVSGPSVVHFINTYNAGYTLTYDATSGGWGTGYATKTQTETKLSATEDILHTLKYQGAEGDGGAPEHADAVRVNENGENEGPFPVVFIGWAASDAFTNDAGQSMNLNSHIFGAGEQFPDIVTEVAIPTVSTVYAVWGYDENGDGTADTQQIVIWPADITVYSGGDGYSSVIGRDEAVEGDESTVEGTSGNGLPTPGFYITLPYDLDSVLKNGHTEGDGDLLNGAIDLSDILSFSYKYETEERTWTLSRYDLSGESQALSDGIQRFIYRLNDDSVTNTPIRLQFKDENGNLTTSDDFDISLSNLNQTYSMTIYAGALEQNRITADILGIGETYSICVGDGLLTVRGLNDYDSTNPDSNPVKTIQSSEPSTADGIQAHADGEVTYYINDSNLEVADGTKVMLLVDSIVPDGTSDLKEKAVEAVTLITADHQFEYQYLDLVDTSNGNAYVTLKDSGDAINIYWEVPENADTSKPIYIVHYDGLDRNFENLDDVLGSVKLTVYYYIPEGSAVSKPVNTDNVTYVEMEAPSENNGNLVFQTSSFSPFAVVYEAEEPVVQYTITATAGPNGSISPSGNVTVNAGGSRTFTFNANSGYHIDTVTVDGRVISVSGSSYTFSNVQANHTIHVTFAENSGDSKPSDHDYYVYYYRNYGATSARNEGYDSGERVTIRDNDWWDRDGYVFEGWNTEPDGSGRDYEPGDEFNIHSDLRLYAQWSRSSDGDGGDGPQLNKDEHIAYVSGTPEGLVKPEDFITREEVATIFFRLLTDESRAEYITEYNPYPDLSPDRWSYYSITTMTNGELMLGRPGGVFEPSAYITRGEFAVVAAQFSNAQYSGPDLFSDISDHWARDYINRAANEGWIAGYPDGSFGPDDYITRAQVMALVNEVLDRAPDADYMLDDMIVWPDNPEGAWYYEDVQEATNSHSYEWRNTQHTSEEWEDFIPMKPFNELVREAFNASR